MRLCSVEGCNRKYKAAGFCSIHYRRNAIGADLFKGRTDPSEIVLHDAHASVTLTKGLIAKISLEDVELVSRYRWYALTGPWSPYARTEQTNPPMQMHILIIQPPKGFVVHHKDGDGLNNTRWNLSVITQAIHSRMSKLREDKTAKYRGVYKRGDKFIAEIWRNYEKIYLGIFNTEKEAAMAYTLAATEFEDTGSVIESRWLETSEEHSARATKATNTRWHK